MVSSFIYIGECLDDNIKVLYIVVFIMRIQYLDFSSLYIFFLGLNIVLKKKLLITLNLR